MGIRVLFYFAIVNAIITALSGWLASQFTYENFNHKLFSVPISTNLSQNLFAIEVNILFFWGIIGFLFGTWSWLFFNKLLNELFVSFGSPYNVPDTAIQNANTRHITQVTIISAIIWLLIGIVVVFLLKSPEGFTKNNTFLIIGGYFFTGGLCSFIAHKLLMLIGSIMQF